MGKKNYSCESSDSCSLVSVTGISANSSSSESYSSTAESSNSHSYSCSKSSSDSCSSSSSSSCSSSSSSSCPSSSSSSCPSSSSSSCEPTYSDNSTSEYSSSSTSSSSTSSSSSSTTCSCEVPSKCVSVSSSKCEEQNGKHCEKLVKRYNCAKEELLAISDIIVVLNFIKNKLIAVQPNIDLRHVQTHSVESNIDWLECFVDTLFCVLRKNEAYKIIKVKESKLKNDKEIITDNRTYLIRVKYQGKNGEVCKNIPLVFQWSQLTNNDAKSYKAVLNYVVKEIDNYVKGYQAASTIPFLC